MIPRLSTFLGALFLLSAVHSCIHPSAQSASLVRSDRMGGGSPMRLCEAGRGGPSDHPNLSENQPCFSKQQLPQTREAGAEPSQTGELKNGY